MGDPTIERVPASPSVYAARRSGIIALPVIAIIGLPLVAGELALAWYGRFASLACFTFERPIAWVGEFLLWLAARNGRTYMLRIAGPAHLTSRTGLLRGGGEFEEDTVLRLHGGQIGLYEDAYDALGLIERVAVVDHDPEYTTVYEVRDPAGNRLYPIPDLPDADKSRR